MQAFTQREPGRQSQLTRPRRWLRLVLTYVATVQKSRLGAGTTKKLRPMGNSFGIIIDRPIMDLLGIEPGAELELTPHDGGLLLRPVEVAKDHKARVRAASIKVRKIHRAALKELAE